MQKLLAPAINLFFFHFQNFLIVAESKSVKFLHIHYDLHIHLHICLHIREFLIGLPLGTTILSYEYANEFVTTSHVANCNLVTLIPGNLFVRV